MREIDIIVREEELNSAVHLLRSTAGKIVCIDIDNTLANTNAELKRMGYCTDKYPNKKLNEDFWFGYDGQSAMVKAKPITETLSLAEYISAMQAEVVLATTRHPALAKITEDWLTRYRLVYPVFYVHNKLLIEADVYIEDNPAEIKTLLRADRPVFIPEWPYNAGIRHKNVIHYTIGGRSL
jgi:hypothetical protein